MEKQKLFLFLHTREEIEDFLEEYLYFGTLYALADDLFKFYQKKARTIAINLKSSHFVASVNTDDLVNALNNAEECHVWHNDLRAWEMEIIADQLVLPTAVLFSEPQPAVRLVAARDNDVERAAKRELAEKIIHNYDGMIHPEPRKLLRLLDLAQDQGFEVCPEYYEGESYYRNREH